MDAAHYAAMSDPLRNRQFRRRWDAPPLKPKRPPMGGTIGRAGAVYDISSELDLAKVFARFKHDVTGEES